MSRTFPTQAQRFQFYGGLKFENATQPNYKSPLYKNARPF
jgi:hypothetical protein